MKTLYELLGVRHQATLSEIERGFRESLDAHRARSGLQPERDQRHLQAIAAAYRILSSPTRRQLYDQKLQSAEKPARLPAAAHSRIGFIWVALVCIVLLIAAAMTYRYNKGRGQREAQMHPVKKLQAENNLLRTLG